MVKILIAEDEKILAEVLKEEFKAVGFKVFSAETGKDALEIMRSKTNRPDAVLLDLLMPVMDGFTVLEKVAKDKVYGLKDIPIIVLSNLGQDAEIKRALQLGAADYFVKSQHPLLEVVEKVKEFLEKIRRADIKNKK